MFVCLADNAENQELAQRLKAPIFHTSKKKKETKKEVSAPATPTPKESQSAPRKRKLEATSDAVEASASKKLQLTLPTNLSAILVDNWEQITRNKQLIPMPRKPTVGQIFQTFLAEKQRKPETQEIYREIAEGLRQYFDRALGTLLLYRFERPQYKTMLQNGQYNKMSDCYGAEHLLRLFVHFPDVAQQCFWKKDELIMIRQFNSELYKWLDQHHRRLFSTTYIETDDAYWAQFNDVQLEQATET
jgi:mortality factor 4-like protein 1